MLGPVTSRFSMYSTPTTARSRNSGFFVEKSTALPDLVEHQLNTSPAPDFSPAALSPTLSDGNGSNSTGTELNSPSSPQHEAIYNSLPALQIRDDWFDDTQGYYPYHLTEEEYSGSDPTIRKFTTTPNSSFVPSISRLGVEYNWENDKNDADENESYSNVNAMRSIFDELGYLGSIITRN